MKRLIGVAVALVVLAGVGLALLARYVFTGSNVRAAVEAQVSAALGQPVTIGGIGASNVAIGGFLGLALLFIGIGAIQWARKLMGDHEIIEMRHPSVSSDDDRNEALEAFNTGVTESGIGRRPLIRNSLIGAMAALGLPADSRFDVRDVVTGQRWVWGSSNYVRLDAFQEPVHLLVVEGLHR